MSGALDVHKVAMAKQVAKSPVRSFAYGSTFTSAALKLDCDVGDALGGEYFKRSFGENRSGGKQHLPVTIVDVARQPGAELH
jgi:hypothetical protein